MISKLIKRLMMAGVVVGVVLGCDSVANRTGSGTSGENGNTGANNVDSQFSDAPASPGGTGGVSTTVDDTGEVVGQQTRSFFTAFQVDPMAEDSAGPKFVVAADIDQDGLMDLVSAWNQSQPIQLHLQRRDANANISFRTITLAGTTPIAVVSGLEVGQINNDGWLDVVVLSKATGRVTLCPENPPSEISPLEGEIVILFSPGNAGQIADGDRWTEMLLVNPFVAVPWIHNQFPGIEFVSFEDSKTQPEWNGFTALAVANVDGLPGDDIIVSLNPGECENLGQKPPTNTVDLWLNPGPGLAETSALWGVPVGSCCVAGAAPPCVGTLTEPECMVRGGAWTPGQRCPQLQGACDVGATCFELDTKLQCEDRTTPLVSAIFRVGELCSGALITTCNVEPAPFSRVPITLMADAPQVKDVEIMDVDSDGDLDVVATFTNSISRNLRWARNPLIPHRSGGPGGLAELTAGTTDGWRLFATGWQRRPIGQVDPGADIITTGDVDGDGFDDVLVRSLAGQIVQWFRRPNAVTVQPEFPPSDTVPDRFDFPWPVFTLTEFDNQEPEAIAIGDLTGDDRPEVIVAAEGAVFWYDGTTAQTVFDPWAPNTIIQDNPLDSTNATQAGPAAPPPIPGSGVGVTMVDTSTQINSLLVVDLDGDGRNDIVGTLDRRSGTGLSDDRLVWYRNTRTEDAP